VNLPQLVDTLDEATYQRLKQSIETGRWPDGRLLSSEQRENSLLLLIAYETRHLPTEARTGYLPPKSDCDPTPGDSAAPLVIRHRDETHSR
jgi:uncharacterized protein YeaC (DUF1315 family)